MPLKIGDSVNDYKVTSIINFGGMANSYFANKSYSQYFLKEYTDPKESDPVFKKFYDNQSILIERLNKMGSIAEKFVDHFVDEGIYYQVKEKLEGIDLVEYLTTHNDYAERLQLSIVFCGILRNLHSNKIVHQDLKPAQVMLVDDEIGKKTKLGYRLILADFDWSIPDGKVVKNVGTISYKSPEHYNNKTPTEKSDIFTAGIMIYEFLTGQNPYDFDDFLDDNILSERVLKKKIFAEPQKLNTDINEEINNIILDCLEPNPSKRPDLEKIQDTLIGREKLKSIVTSGLSKIVLKSGSSSYVISSNKEIDRALLKTFFKDITDDKGNPIYKYCDEEKPMLFFTQEDGGEFYVAGSEDTKNYFLLNDKRIKSEKLKINRGDTLKLYSTNESKIVGSLSIE